MRKDGFTPNPDYAQDSSTEPVTIAIVHQVRQGHEAAFEETLQKVILAASTFSGYLGSEVLYPSTRQGKWQLVLRFDTLKNLQNWENSPICQGWIARAEALAEAPPQVERVNGLEAWFALPERPNISPPPKWKTAIVSAIGIYPMISLMPGLLSPLTRGLPSGLATLVNIAIMMPIMTWVVMPQVTRLFKGWLYPVKQS
ncbi:MAG: antibiotic biosynthesis monooxygenase [Oscillatoriophycideae cyanobacterium NC_groundwater_1537_Pr4_S-0.65um_50_18]|nr:antibiotic biosynthesis monooxygenase [Oscillatoriophycideae cyanobacterium NC_groundwater_1537_Pr4_S-0.65um_50_18]